MAEIIGSLVEAMIMSFPTKKNRALHKKFRLLRKESWYKDRYSTWIQMNRSVSNFVGQYDIEKIVNDPEKTRWFQIELEKIVKKDNL